MLDALFTPLFAWSSHGHAELTSLGLAVAIAKLVASGKTYFLRQLSKYRVKIGSYGSAEEGMAISEGAGEAGGQYIIQHTEDPALVPDDLDRGAVRRALNLEGVALSDADVEIFFAPLPGIVVFEDIHLGNIPNHGEQLERDSQVRHFMRSRPDVTSEEAYRKSRDYIFNHLIGAWSCFRGALADPHGFWENVGSIFEASSGTRAFFFRDGLKHLGAALHTLEDSYAPGHVRRSSAEIIERVNIWDAENQNADPARNWDGHHAYDDPSNPTSQPHYYAARAAVGAVIFEVLVNVDQDEGTARQAIGNALDARLIAVCTAD
jgi:hypothetical protein